MRIANLRSTNTASISPLLKENERAGASFRDVLVSSASESAQPVKSSAAATGVAAQTNAEAADRNEQPLATAAPKDQNYRQDENQQRTATSIDQKPAVAQTPQSPSPTRSTTTSANSNTNRDERPQMSATALAAKIAATVVLPVATPDASAASAIAVPAAPPRDEEGAGGDRSDSSEWNRGASTGKVAGGSAEGAHSEIAGQGKLQAPDSKTTDGTVERDTDASWEAQKSSAAAPALAGFMLNGNECNDASQLSNLILPGLSLVPEMADANLSAAKDAQGKTFDLAAGKGIDATAAGNAGKNNQSNGATASGDSPVRNVPAGDQTAQHTQADASQIALAAPKNTDGAAPQIQVIAAQPASHEAPAARIRTDLPAEATRASNLPTEAQNADNAATSAINTARVIQSMGETEMRLGMRSAEFGDISIRTAVSQQQMMAQISVDHSDLGKAISAHIPAIEEKLGGELGLRALVQVNQGGMSFSGERGSSSQQQPKSYSFPAITESIQPSAEADPIVLRTTTLESGNSYRLDIRA